MLKFLLTTLLSIVCFFSEAYAVNFEMSKKQLDYARKLYRSGEPARCLLLTNRIIDSYSSNRDIQHNDSLILMQAYFLCGNSNISIGSEKRGLQLLQLSSRYAKGVGDDKFLAQIYNSLFSVYYNTLDFAQAHYLLSQAIELSGRNGDIGNLTRLYNNKGLTYYAQGQYADALDYMQKALGNTRPNEKLERAQIYTNIAEVYYKRKSFVKSEEWLIKAIAEMHGMPLTARNMQSYLNLALVKAQNRKYAEAQKIQSQIYGVIPTLPLPQKVNSLRQLADINFVVGDSLRGLRDMLLYDELADSLQKQNYSTQTQQLLIAYDSERLSQHNNSLKDSLKARTVVIYGSMTFLVVVVAFSVVLWIRYREDRRKGQLISAQKEQLLLYEQKEHEREQRKMKMELEHKSRQLTSYTMDLAAVNEFHHKTAEEIETVRKLNASNAGDDGKNAIDEKLRNVQSSLMHFNDKPVNDDFRIFFEEVHPDYLKKLSHSYPKLSENDLRLCVYIFLGMSTKEIAALTCREVRSIESSRNRLRKKLGLAAGADVKTFLMSEEDRFNSMQ